MRTWIGKPDERFPFPEYVALDRCPECRSLVLTEDLDAHHAFHLRNGHL